MIERKVVKMCVLAWGQESGKIRWRVEGVVLARWRHESMAAGIRRCGGSSPHEVLCVYWLGQESGKTQW